jgi:uncharacterized protein
MRSFLLLVIVLAATPLAAQNPPPTASPGLVRLVPPVPTPASFIADAPNVVPAEAQALLDARIRAVQDSGLGDIGVAIIPSIGEYQPYEVGVAIYREWRIGRIDSVGSARRHLGVLLLIVPKELAPDHKGQCWITTGRGAEGIVTDATSGAICRDRIIPHLITRDYPAALSAGIEAIADRMREDQGLASTPLNPPGAGQVIGGRGGVTGSANRNRGGVPGAWLVMLAIATVLISAILGVRWNRVRPRRCPTCGKTMHRLPEEEDDAKLTKGQALEERLGSVDYDVWLCACGETLVIPYRKLTSGYSECPKCHVRALKTTRHIINPPTHLATGLAEDTTRCASCDATSKRRVVLARLQNQAAAAAVAAGAAASSGWGGGGGGGGGFSGGGSFGGSGSTSGGGGGASY